MYDPLRSLIVVMIFWSIRKNVANQVHNGGILLLNVAYCLCLVAAVLVMNVTLITVTQRTAEIGLLKAIGASGNLVSRIFLTEAGLMTLSGAIGGVLLGEALLWAGRRLFPDIPFAAPLWAEVTAVVVAVVAGLLFALMPARRAARLEPVNALMKK